MADVGKMRTTLEGRIKELNEIQDKIIQMRVVNTL
jgi:hypothetical protein